MTVIPHDSFPSCPIWCVGLLAASRVELVCVMHGEKSGQGLVCGVIQYRMRLAADCHPREGCEDYEGGISTDDLDQGEAIGVDAWETYSYSGTLPRFVVGKGGRHEVSETCVGEEDWGTWCGQAVCWASSAGLGEVPGNGRGVDGGTGHGQLSAAEILAAHPSLILLDWRLAGPSSVVPPYQKSG